MSLPQAATYRPLRALFLLCGAQILFALLDATGKTLARDMGIPLISLIRHGGQALLMLLVLGPRMGTRLFQTQNFGLQLCRGMAISGFTLFFFSALFRLPQAEATAINFISPFLVMLLAGFLLNEKISGIRWIGAGIGFLGMLLLVRPGGHLDKIGIAFALATIVCNVAFQLLTRRLALTDNSFTTMFFSAAVSVIVSTALLPLQGLWGGWPTGLDNSQLWRLLSLGVLGAISQWCLIRAYVWSNVAFIAPLLFMQLIWSTGTGYIFFGQLPDRYSLCGNLIVLMSGTITMLYAAKTPP